MSALSPADRSQLDDAAAVAFALPEVLIGADIAQLPPSRTLPQPITAFGTMVAPRFSMQLFPPGYTDHTLRESRRQGPSGLADAGTAFFTAFPDGRVKVLQQMLVGDRIVSHLRVTGTFTGRRKGTGGAGQAIHYRATDIMRVADGLIVEN